MKLVARIDYGVSNRSLLLWYDPPTTFTDSYLVEIIENDNVARIRLAGEEMRVLCETVLDPIRPRPFYPLRQ